MRTITLEEHAAIPELWDLVWPLAPRMRSLLEDMGEGRLADMDANGIDMQVLSLQMQPACDEVDPEKAAKAVRAFNEAAAAAVEAHPDRFALFAALPLHDPDAAALELERAVHDLDAKGALVGTRAATGFLSDEANWPLWEAAERLGSPSTCIRRCRRRRSTTPTTPISARRWGPRWRAGHGAGTPTPACTRSA
jgi:uncharacterized protein